MNKTLHSSQTHHLSGNNSSNEDIKMITTSIEKEFEAEIKVLHQVKLKPRKEAIKNLLQKITMETAKEHI